MLRKGSWIHKRVVPSGNLTNYWKWPFLVDFPIEIVIFHSYVSHYQRVSGGAASVRVIHSLLSKSWGALHLFTGCGNGYGTVGIAWRGGMCDKRGYNTGEHSIDWFSREKVQEHPMIFMGKSHDLHGKIPWFSWENLWFPVSRFSHEKSTHWSMQLLVYVVLSVSFALHDHFKSQMDSFFFESWEGMMTSQVTHHLVGGAWNMTCIFPWYMYIYIYMEFHHPIWLSFILFRGASTSQYIILYTAHICIYIYTI